MPSTSKVGAPAAQGNEGTTFKATVDAAHRGFEVTHERVSEHAREARAIHRTALADYDRLKAFLAGEQRSYDGHSRLLYDDAPAVPASPSKSGPQSPPRLGSHFPHVERALNLRKKRLGQDKAGAKPTFNQRALQSPSKKSAAGSTVSLGNGSRSGWGGTSSRGHGTAGSVDYGSLAGDGSVSGSAGRLETSPSSGHFSTVGHRGSIVLLPEDGPRQSGESHQVSYSRDDNDNNIGDNDAAMHPMGGDDNAIEVRLSQSTPLFMRGGFRTSSVARASVDTAGTAGGGNEGDQDGGWGAGGVRSSRQIRASFIKKCREQFLAVQAREEAAVTIQSVARMYITRRWLLENWADLQRMKAAGDFRRAKMLRLCLRLWSRYHHSRSRLMHIMLHRRFRADESFLSVCMQPFNAGELLLSVGKYGMAAAYHERKLKLKSLLAIFFFAAFGEQGERFWSMKKQVSLAQNSQQMRMPFRASPRNKAAIRHRAQESLDMAGGNPLEGQSVDSSVYFKAGIAKAKGKQPAAKKPSSSSGRPPAPQLRATPAGPRHTRTETPASGVGEERSRVSLGKQSTRSKASTEGAKSVLESISPTMSPPTRMTGRAKAEREAESKSRRLPPHEKNGQPREDEESEGSDIEHEFQRFMRARQEKDERWKMEEEALRISTESLSLVPETRAPPDGGEDMPAEKPRKASAEWQPFKEWRNDDPEILYESSETSENFSFAGDEWVPNAGRLSRYGEENARKGHAPVIPRRPPVGKGSNDAPLTLMQRLEQQTLQAMMDSSDEDSEVDNEGF